MNIIDYIALWTIFGLLLTFSYVFVTQGKKWSNTELIIIYVLCLPISLILLVSFLIYETKIYIQISKKGKGTSEPIKTKESGR